MNILEQLKIWLLKAKGYKPLDGFIPERKSPKAWVFGASGKILNESKMYLDYLPTDEYQKRFNVESMSCVSFSSVNVNEITILFKKKLNNNEISPDNLQWLEDNGYFDENGNINFSDRYIALMSFTSRNGNTGARVFGTIKNFGLIPESMFPWNPEDNTWDKYHDRSKITQEMKNMGFEFKRRFPIEYYVVYRNDFDDALKESPLQVYVNGNYRIINGVLQYNNSMSNHAVCLVGSDENYWYIYDSYEPFLKKVVKNYPFWTGQNMYTGQKFSYGYKVNILENIIKKKMIKTIKQKNQAEHYLVDEKAGTINAFGGWESYQKFLWAGWCEPVLEVDEKYSYLRQKYGKKFVKGQEVGVIK